MASFEHITGPKADLWLVRTVAGLLVVIGIVLLVQRSRTERGVAWIAAGCSFVLGLVALVSAASGRIYPVYLLDAAAHLGFATAWAYTLVRLRA